MAVCGTAGSDEEDVVVDTNAKRKGEWAAAVARDDEATPVPKRC